MKRKIDSAGMWTIAGNPITHDGVAMYSGRAIDATGEFGLDPNKLYPVYRPFDELTKAAESFNGKPLINNHEMIGTEGSLTNPDEKNIGGTICNVRPDETRHGYIVADMTIFSKEIQDLVEDGKCELSLGYWCKYRPEQGEYNGQHYDFVQYDLEGNHIALVNCGRMGSECRVLDEKERGVFVYDSMEKPMTKKKKTLDADELREEIAGLLKGATDDLLAKCKDILAPSDPASGADDDPPVDVPTDGKTGDDDEPVADPTAPVDPEPTAPVDGETGDDDPTAPKDGEDNDEPKGGETGDEPNSSVGTDGKPKFRLGEKVWYLGDISKGIRKGLATITRIYDVYGCPHYEIKYKDGTWVGNLQEMDFLREHEYSLDSAPNGMDMREAVKEVSRRNRLYKSVEPLVGSFDCDEMTARDVARYAANKLNIACVDGAEVECLCNYLMGRDAKEDVNGVAKRVAADSRESVDAPSEAFKNYLA